MGSDGAAFGAAKCGGAAEVVAAGVADVWRGFGGFDDAGSEGVGEACDGEDEGGGGEAVEGDPVVNEADKGGEETDGEQGFENAVDDAASARVAAVGCCGHAEVSFASERGGAVGAGLVLLSVVGSVGLGWVVAGLSDAARARRASSRRSARTRSAPMRVGW